VDGCCLTTDHSVRGKSGVIWEKGTQKRAVEKKGFLVICRVGTKGENRRNSKQKSYEKPFRWEEKEQRLKGKMKQEDL